MHVVGRRHVAGDRGGDGAHLFIAREQQEGRRAAIALDADRVEAGFGMRQFAMTVRRHRAAGMQIRIDQRAERFRAFEPGIEIETQARASSDKSGRCPVAAMIRSTGPIRRRTVDRLAFDDDPVVFCVERQDGKSRPQGHALAVDKLLHVRAKFAARRAAGRNRRR